MLPAACSVLLASILIVADSRVRCRRLQVKVKLKSKEAYGDFLKCLNLYAQEIVSKEELANLVTDLIARFPDLAARSQHLE